MDDNKLIEEAARLISGAGRLVAFSGAGVSEESGIPTFRDPGGLWDRYNPSEISSGDIFAEALTVDRSRPNGHLAPCNPPDSPQST